MCDILPSLDLVWWLRPQKLVGAKILGSLLDDPSEPIFSVVLLYVFPQKLVPNAFIFRGSSAYLQRAWAATLWRCLLSFPVAKKLKYLLRGFVSQPYFSLAEPYLPSSYSVWSDLTGNSSDSSVLQSSDQRCQWRIRDNPPSGHPPCRTGASNACRSTSPIGTVSATLKSKECELHPRRV